MELRKSFLVLFADLLYKLFILFFRCCRLQLFQALSVPIDLRNSFEDRIGVLRGHSIELSNALFTVNFFRRT